MTVDTKTATGRRKVAYQSYDDLLADAEQLAAGEVQQIGNWSLGQILTHLATSVNSSIDGFSFKAPLPLRIMATLFMKKKLIYQEVPAGFKIPKQSEAVFLPNESVSIEEALAALREAIERAKAETQRAPHPVFGNLTREETDSFNLRHAEMHMSFVKPASA